MRKEKISRFLGKVAIPGLVALGLLLGLPGTASAAKYKFDFKFKTKSTADSTKKDYADVTYDPVTYDPITELKSYDKTFYSSINDLSFALKGDLSKTQFLDFKETLHYQKYNPQDYDAYALDTYKYTYTDHYFNMTYGQSFGTKDAFQLDYINNIYRIPIDNLNEYISNMGKARFNHKIDKNTSLGFEGIFEEKNYLNDPSSKYREKGFVVDYAKFFPERIRYRPVPSSSRGNKSTFENTPTGMTTKKAVDYYTNWSKPVNETEPQTKYVPEVVRGDFYLNLIGDYRERERPNLNNKYRQPQGTLKATYDANDHWKFYLEDTYYRRSWDSESTYYYLFNQNSNRFTLTSTYRPNKVFTHILTYTNEFYKHENYGEQNYKINSYLWESYYISGKHYANLYVKDSLTRYDQARQYYSNSNQLQAILTYDYNLTKNLILHLKDEMIRYKYLNDENLFYSNYDRNTWKVSFEKILCKTQAIEIGYQNKRERHDVFTSNDITEKTTFFNWTQTY